VWRNPIGNGHIVIRGSGGIKKIDHCQLVPLICIVLGVTVMKIAESLTACGHANIRGTHPTTLEITRAGEVTVRGDCIVAVRASKSLSDFGEPLRRLLRKHSSDVTLRLEVDGLEEVIKGVGDPRLSLTSTEDIVCRKSSFVCGRTLMVRADKSAAEIDRNIIRVLRNSKNKVYVTVQVDF